MIVEHNADVAEAVATEARWCRHRKPSDVAQARSPAKATLVHRETKCGVHEDFCTTLCLYFYLIYPVHGFPQHQPNLAAVLTRSEVPLRSLRRPGIRLNSRWGGG